MAILTILLHGVEVLVERCPVILAAVIILKLLWKRYGMGLNGIPGPTLQSFSMIPRAHQVWKGKIHLHDMNVHKKYGKLVRIGPRLVSIADVTAMNTVYGINTKFYKVCTCSFISSERKTKLFIVFIL